MAAGLAIVVTDGWGMAEYIDHGRNGLIVPGRYGTCSWMDSNGILREYYKPVFSADPAVTNGLVEVLSSLIKDAAMRRNLGDAGLRGIETRFSIERWNRVSLRHSIKPCRDLGLTLRGRACPSGAIRPVNSIAINVAS